MFSRNRPHEASRPRWGDRSAGAHHASSALSRSAASRAKIATGGGGYRGASGKENAENATVVAAAASLAMAQASKSRAVQHYGNKPVHRNTAALTGSALRVPAASSGGGGGGGGGGGTGRHRYQQHTSASLRASMTGATPHRRRAVRSRNASSTAAAANHAADSAAASAGGGGGGGGGMFAALKSSTRPSMLSRSLSAAASSSTSAAAIGSVLKSSLANLRVPQSSGGDAGGDDRRSHQVHRYQPRAAQPSSSATTSYQHERHDIERQQQAMRTAAPSEPAAEPRRVWMPYARAKATGRVDPKPGIGDDSDPASPVSRRKYRPSEVPDFEAMHRQWMDRLAAKKRENKTTDVQPFAFLTDKRSMEPRRRSGSPDAAAQPAEPDGGGGGGGGDADGGGAAASDTAPRAAADDAAPMRTAVRQPPRRATPPPLDVSRRNASPDRQRASSMRRRPATAIGASRVPRASNDDDATDGGESDAAAAGASRARSRARARAHARARPRTASGAPETSRLSAKKAQRSKKKHNKKKKVTQVQPFSFATDRRSKRRRRHRGGATATATDTTTTTTTDDAPATTVASSSVAATAKPRSSGGARRAPAPAPLAAPPSAAKPSGTSPPSPLAPPRSAARKKRPAVAPAVSMMKTPAARVRTKARVPAAAAAVVVTPPVAADNESTETPPMERERRLAARRQHVEAHLQRTRSVKEEMARRLLDIQEEELQLQRQIEAMEADFTPSPSPATGGAADASATLRESSVDRISRAVDKHLADGLRDQDDVYAMLQAQRAMAAQLEALDLSGSPLDFADDDADTVVDDGDAVLGGASLNDVSTASSVAVAPSVPVVLSLSALSVARTAAVLAFNVTADDDDADGEVLTIDLLKDCEAYGPPDGVDVGVLRRSRNPLGPALAAVDGDDDGAGVTIDGGGVLPTMIGMVGNSRVLPTMVLGHKRAPDTHRILAPARTNGRVGLAAAAVWCVS